MPRDRVGSGGSCGSSGGHGGRCRPQHQHQHQDQAAAVDPPNVTRCCAPNGCGFSADGTIGLDDLHGVVRILCNNEHCPAGQYMHVECFESWEQTVLSYLRSTGRARSWSEKQRLQNLWTKKGYDLVFKACGCRCGKGHLRKDLDWVEPSRNVQAAMVAGGGGHAVGAGIGAIGGAGGGGGNDAAAEEQRRKRNRKKNRNDRPTLHIGSPASSLCSSFVNASSMSTSSSSSSAVVCVNRESRPMLRLRSNSMSSTGSTSGSSPPSSSGPGDTSPRSPSHVVMLIGNGGHGGGGGGGGVRRRSSVKLDFFAEQPEPSGSIFLRRSDYSSFNSLPRHKINSYHIKMEEDGNCGNDEIRCFVLSNLSAAHVSRVSCVLCECSMPIFDQLPLIDGTFFLSPRQHSHSCLPVKTSTTDVNHRYLCAVCMGCLEGWSSSLRCRFCAKQWRGTSLMLGAMYSYDIFAADPCCIERLECSRCRKLVILADQRCSYFSDYSSRMACPHCGHVDHHFVKGLATYYRGPK